MDGPLGLTLGASNQEDSEDAAVIRTADTGDMFLLVDSCYSMRGRVRFQVSSHVLSTASHIFKQLIDNIDETKTLYVRKFDGRIVNYMCNVLHDTLDAGLEKLRPKDLFSLAQLCEQYECTQPIADAVRLYWDSYFSSPTIHEDISYLVGAALFLDDPQKFLQATHHYILLLVVCGAKVVYPTFETPRVDSVLTRARNRLPAILEFVRAEISTGIGPCVYSLSPVTSHRRDTPVGVNIGYYDPNTRQMAAPPGVTQPMCYTQATVANRYLAELRRGSIWPDTCWPFTLAILLTKIQNFKIPHVDTNLFCRTCFNVADRFAWTFNNMRMRLQQRSFGLCIDCINWANYSPNQCRIHHPKPFQAKPNTRQHPAQPMAVGQAPAQHPGQRMGQNTVQNAQFPGQRPAPTMGQNIGQHPGPQHIGQHPGHSMRQQPAQNAGQIVGQHPLQNAGQHSGQLPVQHMGQYSGQNVGQNAGQHMGQNPGPHQPQYVVIGQNAGQQHVGPNMVQQPGQNIGQNIGQHPGQHVSMGQHPGQQHPGQHPGQQTMGPSMGHHPGQGPGQNMGHNAGHQVGQQVGIGQHPAQNMGQNIGQHHGHHPWQQPAHNAGQVIGQHHGQQTMGLNMGQHPGQHAGQQHVQQAMGLNMGQHPAQNIGQNMGQNPGQDP
ncbi:hypothetical protein K470DRAFT_277885 [Piedraia hortae CBS 480.64]|uniref:BTB domain-containing protein n=1 Tax=Piedraia hortae CBS 480.64 TaxID=1314780 RepID=A0A6A7BVY3_9PEZI|nr:hypothetical protein K470DRAFT_277885 [Piedraia hortae CBS 480.64]